MSVTPEKTGNGKDFSIKEILTDFVLPRLDSIDSKLDKKADAAELSALQIRTEAESSALRIRLETLEKNFVTREEKHTLEKRIQAGELFDSGHEQSVNERAQLRADVDSLKTWRNRLAGATAVLAAAFAPVLIAVLERTHW